MIKLKKLIQEEVIEKLLFEDSESDGKETVTYTYNGKKHKIQRNTALGYARQVSMGDEDVTDQMKAAVKAFPDIAQEIGLGDDDAEAEKEAGKLKGGDFDREADKDDGEDKKDALRKMIDDLDDKIQNLQARYQRAASDGRQQEIMDDITDTIDKKEALEDKLADME